MDRCRTDIKSEEGRRLFGALLCRGLRLNLTPRFCAVGKSSRPNGLRMRFRPDGLTCTRPQRGLTWCGKENRRQTRWTQTGCSSSQRQLSLPWFSFGICCRAELLLPRQPRRQLQRRRNRDSSRTRSVSS